jgi:hypothetical protein
MAKLRAKQRKRLKASSFAYPRQRKYPIHDKAHARNALARAAQSNTFGSYSHVRRAVVKKFPSLKGNRRKSKRRTK